jgi:hypothetical protein
MTEKFNNKKEKESLNYLEQNFMGNEDNDLESIQKVNNGGIGNIGNIGNIGEFLDTPSNEYYTIPLEVLPCGMFYKPGTKIAIRSAKVQEVQAYSVVDDNNYLDITEKMNNILKSCLKYTYANGMLGSYKDLRDGDRLFLIFMIRELTFPGGKNLSKDVTCDSCGNEFKIELRATSSNTTPKTFVNYEMPEKLKKFFSPQERVFVLKINGVDYKLAPPTIGIQEIFFGDIKDKIQVEKNPNVAFLKIASCMLYDRSKISEDGIKEKEAEFKRLDMSTFQILNQAVNMMLFGIKEMKTTCPSCGQEVHTNMTFPGGASSIFISSVDEYFG